MIKIKSVFVSVDNRISTLCRLTEKWSMRIFVGCQIFVKSTLFLLSTSIRAGIAVQGPLVCIYLYCKFYIIGALLMLRNPPFLWPLLWDQRSSNKRVCRNSRCYNEPIIILRTDFIFDPNGLVCYFTLLDWGSKYFVIEKGDLIVFSRPYIYTSMFQTRH